MKFGLDSYVRDSDQAFEDALACGEMTENHLADWMYIYSDDAAGYFKHILTRKFWRVTRATKENSDARPIKTRTRLDFAVQRYAFHEAGNLEEKAGSG